MDIDLKEHLLTWDGKSKDDIEAIYHGHSNSSDFLDGLIKLCSDGSINVGATWLLKYGLEHDLDITKGQMGNVLKILPEITHWETKLHILQCLPYFSISKTYKAKVELFLRETIADNNKFVRTWSYNGFYVLSQQYPEYVEETKQFFDRAMRDEAASVKARIRNLMKKGFS